MEFALSFYSEGFSMNHIHAVFYPKTDLNTLSLEAQLTTNIKITEINGDVLIYSISVFLITLGRRNNSNVKFYMFRNLHN